MARSALGGATLLLAVTVLAGCAASQPLNAPAPVATTLSPAQQYGPVDQAFDELKAANAKKAACAKIRETLLTGSSSDIRAGMNTLLADTSADTYVRGLARRYLHRFKSEDLLREGDISSLLTACT
jgi:outer membrane murein-binding lipoprotein Lpp